MLFEIFNTVNNPKKWNLHPPFVPGIATHFVESLNDLSFQHLRCKTNQFARCFNPYFCEKWNKLPVEIVHSADVNKFELAIRRHMVAQYGVVVL